MLFNLFRPSFTIILFSLTKSTTSQTVAIAAISTKSSTLEVAIPNSLHKHKINLYAIPAPQRFLKG
ncbi:hypothetical protein D3C76_1169240 [compost metagenome]